MKKIKIIRIIARLNIGGPAVHTILLTEALDKNRFESLLVCGQLGEGEGDMFYYAENKNIQQVFLPQLKRELSFLNDSVAFWKIYRLISKEKPQILHTHTAKAGSIGRLAGIVHNFFIYPGKRIKLVHTFHGHVFSGYFGNFKTMIFIIIERFLAFFTTAVIAVSETVKQELISLHIAQKDKIRVIPLGFELDRLLEIPLGNRDTLNIGIVGRLVPIKNHRLFIDSAAKVLKEESAVKIKFKIIGDGELRRELEEYVSRLNIASQVEFLGWQKDLVDVYSDLDIVALTSINEGTPVSLIEAMASGRAVIATDVGGIRDLLGDETDRGQRAYTDFRVLERGVIVKNRDPQSYTHALLFLLRNNDLRKRMGEASRNFVKNRFTKERLIKDIEELYLEILNT